MRCVSKKALADLMQSALELRLGCVFLIRLQSEAEWRSGSVLGP